MQSSGRRTSRSICMREKDFQSTFNKWLKTTYKESGVFELKLTHSDSLPFSAVQPHQELALWHTQHNQLVYKIPDVGFQNPFDCVSLVEIPAYVVVRYPEFFCLINIDTWQKEAKLSKRKSLTASRAKEICTVYTQL